MDKLASNLRNTRYHQALLPFAADAGPAFIKIDHALNRLDYAAKMDAFNAALRGTSRKIMLSIYGAQTDISNIMFIYRIKKLYGFPAKDILQYLMPCNNKVSHKELYKMAECESVDSLVGLIGDSHYGFLFPKGRESEWENIQAEYFHRIYKKNIYRQDTDIGVAYSYLQLKETDIKNIIIIIEGVRYGLPPEKIAPFLIGYNKPVKRAYAA